MFFYEYRCMLLSYYEQNKFLILANKKSKPLDEVCFFLVTQRCRSPPASDLNLPLKNKFESEE